MREFPRQGNSLVRGNLWKKGGLARKSCDATGRARVERGISNVPKRPGEVQTKRWFGLVVFETGKSSFLESRHRATGFAFGSGVRHNHMRGQFDRGLGSIREGSKRLLSGRAEPSGNKRRPARRMTFGHRRSCC